MIYGLFFVAVYPPCSGDVGVQWYNVMTFEPFGAATMETKCCFISEYPVVVFHGTTNFFLDSSEFLHIVHALLYT